MPHCQAQLWGLLCSCLLGWVGVGGQLHRYSSTHSDAASVVPMSPSSLMSILLTINGPISMIPSVHLHILVSTCRHIYHTHKKVSKCNVVVMHVLASVSTQALPGHRGLRYLHWIHTRYILSCLPLLTCSRRSMRFCTSSRPAL